MLFTADFLTMCFRSRLTADDPWQDRLRDTYTPKGKVMRKLIAIMLVGFFALATVACDKAEDATATATEAAEEGAAAAEEGAEKAQEGAEAVKEEADNAAAAVEEKAEEGAEQAEEGAEKVEEAAEEAAE